MYKCVIRARKVSYNFRPDSCSVVLYIPIYAYDREFTSRAGPNTVITAAAAAVHVEITAKLQRA